MNKKFQSLFWWKYCPGQRGKGFRSTGWQFQSLFWWKYCPGDSTTPATLEALRFQSLFWWKYCPGPSESFTVDPFRLGFNPCSGGSIALGQPDPIVRVRLIVFQSLFWWKYCPGSILCISFEIATVYTNRLRLKISI